MTRVAVVGATGAVGREILAVLAERAFPVSELRLLASERSAGMRLEALGASHEVRPATPEAFRGLDLALFSAGAAVARALAPAARAAGALVVDNSSAFRMDPACPLIVPELNGGEIAAHQGILANPNCSAILFSMAVAPLHRAAGVQRAVVGTYQAVSGAGARAMDELQRQAEAAARGEEPQARVFPAVVLGNVIPWVEAIAENGYSTEENKLRDESRRILGAELEVSATCVRVPVLRAHAQAVHLELREPLSAAEAREACARAPGVRVYEEGFPTPREVAGTDEVHVGRIRADRAFVPGLALWCVMDQLRKGAALNAVQIAERALGVGTDA